jgi:peptidoglycan/LPS O-acetylase OafA/YrhL
VNGYISVDSFFFMGGCLLTFLTFKELDRVKGRLNVIMFYVHRYIR